MENKQEINAPILSQIRHPVFVRREWLHVAILTVIMASTWAVTSVYLVIFQAHIPQPLARRIQQFSPDLDIGTLSTLESYSPFTDALVTEDQRVILKGQESLPGSSLLPTPTTESAAPTGSVSPTPVSSPTPTLTQPTDTPIPTPTL